MENLHIKGKKECRFKEHEFQSRAIFNLYRFSMTRRKTPAQYEFVYNINKAQIIAYRDCGLSLRKIDHSVRSSEAKIP